MALNDAYELAVKAALDELFDHGRPAKVELAAKDSKLVELEAALAEATAKGPAKIVMGDADIAVCGGVEGMIEALPIAAFSMMRASLSRLMV